MVESQTTFRGLSPDPRRCVSTRKEMGWWGGAENE